MSVSKLACERSDTVDRTPLLHRLLPARIRRPVLGISQRLKARRLSSSTARRFIPPVAARSSTPAGWKSGIADGVHAFASKRSSENEQTRRRPASSSKAAPGSAASEYRCAAPIDAERRRDHMQQHSGQHVLSAAFEKLYGFATVSFHMGDESCTIDLATDAVTAKQLKPPKRWPTRSSPRIVRLRFASPPRDEARAMGVRKIPPAEREKLRLIDIRDFDLNACGGTHVRSTGQIGVILLRKTEKVKQGMRVEFVCGLRAVAHRAPRFRDADRSRCAVLHPHLGGAAAGTQVAGRGQVSAEGAASAAGRGCRTAGRRLAATRPSSVRGGHKLVVAVLCRARSRLSSRCWRRSSRAVGTAVALLGCGGAQPSLVFAQTPGLPQRHGRADEGDGAAAGHARRRQSRHGAGRRAGCAAPSRAKRSE